MGKLSSGRFIFTIATAGVFMWASYNNILTNDQIVAVITIVVAFYFHKQKEDK